MKEGELTLLTNDQQPVNQPVSSSKRPSSLTAEQCRVLGLDSATGQAVDFELYNKARQERGIPPSEFTPK